RTMGVISGSALVCGLMIGSGIFSTPGVVVTLTGSAAMAMVYWGLGAFTTFCGAFSYIELGCLMPESGGEQVYLDYCIRKPRQLFGFLFSFCTIVCMRPGSIATNAIIFGKYLIYALYGPAHLVESQSTRLTMEGQQRWLAMLGLLIITAINMVSVKWSLRALDLLTWIKLLVLGLISITGLAILMGLTSVPRSDLWARGFAGTTNKLHRHSSAIFNAFWAYDGWHNLNFCLGELRDPVRNLPLCATGGIAITTVLYLLTNVAFFSVLSMDDISLESEVLAATWGTRVFGPLFGRVVIPLAIAISCAGSISAMVFGVSRVIVAAAQKGYLPYATTWCHISPRTGTPVNALLLNFALVAVYTLGPPPGEAFQFLIDLVSYPSRLFYGLTVVGLLLLRRRDPNLPARVFSVWLPLPYLFLITTVFLAIFPFIPPADGTIIGPNGWPYFLAPLLGAVYTLTGIPFW
ncbi:amino acid/polyamine transporter I, partial [Dimargaris cristalligena]